jgi:hypothetical protein
VQQETMQLFDCDTEGDFIAAKAVE